MLNLAPLPPINDTVERLGRRPNPDLDVMRKRLEDIRKRFELGAHKEEEEDNDK